MVKCSSVRVCLLAALFSALAPYPTTGSNGSVQLGNVLVVSRRCSEENFHSSSVLPKIQAAAADVMQIAALNISTASRINSSAVSDAEAVLKGLQYRDSEQGEQVQAVIHPGCSSNTFLADVNKYFRSILVSYAFSSLPVAPHSNHLRMVPSEEHLAEGVVSLLRYFGWSRLVVLSEDFPVFRYIASSLDEKLAAIVDTINVTVTKSLLSLDTLDDSNVVFPVDNRIILLNSYPAMTRSILCQAWKEGRKFPGYVWVTYEWDHSDRVMWWERGDSPSSSNCNNTEIKLMVEGMLIVSRYQEHAEQGQNFSAFVNGEVIASSVNFDTNYECLAYDAILALAVLVGQSSHPTSEEGISISAELLDSVAFVGASGPVSFKDGIRQLGNISIKQYRKELGLVTIGKQPTGGESPGNFQYEPGESNATVWNNASVPMDGAPLSVTTPPLLPLLVLTYTYATGGIVFAGVCMIFNIVFRKKKLIRLTSPNINYIIIAGAVVFYSSVYTFLYVGRPSFTLLTVICNLRAWLIALGFTLCFGPINVKMWRVYHICHKPNPSMKKMFVKDGHLVLVILGFLMTDLIILTVAMALDSGRYYVRSIGNKERPDSLNENGITVTYRFDRCFSDSEAIWVSLVIGYKLILQAIGAFLAFNIRKVKIRGLNDSREISAILYITTILIFIVVACNFGFGDYINVDGTVYGLSVCTSTTCVLGFIFIPKMIALYKDPNGEKIFTQTPAHNNTVGTIGKSQPAIEEKSIVHALEVKIKGLEGQIEELTKSSPNTTVTSVDLEKDGTTTTSE